ncbi:MAG: GIY-YIG nuclease family protein [Gemmatimonadaceae bacterium]
MDRKERDRAYRYGPRPMVVYRVLNVVDGRALLGRSADLPSVLDRERARLRLCAHPHIALHRDRAVPGPDAFTFEVLDTPEAPDNPGYDAAGDPRILETLDPFDEGAYTPRRVRRR